MPRIPRHPSRLQTAQPDAAQPGRARWRQQLGALITAGGTLLWLGQAAHHIAAS